MERCTDGSHGENTIGRQFSHEHHCRSLSESGIRAA
jgi:hypothetical protein